MELSLDVQPGRRARVQLIDAQPVMTDWLDGTPPHSGYWDIRLESMPSEELRAWFNSNGKIWIVQGWPFPVGDKSHFVQYRGLREKPAAYEYDLAGVAPGMRQQLAGTSTPLTDRQKQMIKAIDTSARFGNLEQHGHQMATTEGVKRARVVLI